jgi:hypothetical protein
MFLNVKTWLTLQSICYFTILVYTSVETSAAAEKCDFWASTAIFESVSACCVILIFKKILRTP